MSLLLAGAMCVIPFLQPRHFPPIRTFYDEWIAFALGAGAIGMAAFARRSQVARIPGLALWLGAFAIFLSARAFSGLATYPQGPLLWAIYAIFAALLVMLGHDLVGHFGQERVCDMLASFLLLGALLNSISGVLQVVGIPRQIDAFVSYLNGTRAIGNIGQSNLYANYLALGEASLAYLFARDKIGRGSTVVAALLLMSGAALAGSRTSLLYALLFALLGYIEMRRASDMSCRRLGISAITLAIAGVLMQWLVPAGLKAVGFSIEGGFDRNSVEWESGRDDSTHLRLLGWQLAWRLFITAPWMGVGPGEFAGAGFVHGLPLELAANDLWTSPHNLVLQLLAETGLIGAGLVGAGLLIWLRRSANQFFGSANLALWWVLACTGIEILHAMLEYPFWYSHFLAVTALIMGVGASGGTSFNPTTVRMLFASSAVAGTVLLGINLRDYFRFELSSPIYAGRTLAAESELERDRSTLMQLSRGLLAPKAELFLFLSLSLESGNPSEKIALGERVMHTWPLREVVLRQCIFLALAGREADARGLLNLARITFTNRGKMIHDAVDSAPEKARWVLEPVLLNPG
jgi:O-antigen ligase